MKDGISRDVKAWDVMLPRMWFIHVWCFTRLLSGRKTRLVTDFNEEGGVQKLHLQFEVDWKLVESEDLPIYLSEHERSG